MTEGGGEDPAPIRGLSSWWANVTITALGVALAALIGLIIADRASFRAEDISCREENVKQGERITKMEANAATNEAALWQEVYRLRDRVYNLERDRRTK